jgi:hypothetical protein
MRGLIFAVIAVGGATIATTGTVAAAQAPRATIQITARDSSGAPINGAELTVKRGIKDVLGQTTTDENGHGVLSVEAKDSSDFQVTMRKIGYARGDRFLSVGPRDTAHVNVTVGRTHAALDTVRVTAKGLDPRWHSYHLDADEIEASDEPIDNAWEMLKRLRPVMLTSRGGCASGVREVWVNGKRIRLPLRPTGLVAQRARVGAPIDARFSYVAVSVLSEIAVEHVQEITYHDCFDHSMAVVGNNDAVFVTLKPGVTYQENVGSFVLDEPKTTHANR